MVKFELNNLKKRVRVLEYVDDIIQLKDIMTEDVVTTGKDASVVDTAKLMEEHGVSSVVIENSGKPVGIVTERDMVRKVIIQSRDRDTPVGEIMTSPPITLGMLEEVTMGATLMVEKGIRRLPIVEDGKLVGMVTAADIINLL